jgi:hypothetical protein
VLCWVVISLLATGDKVAPSDEAKELVIESLLMEPVIRFAHAVLPAEGLEAYDDYCKFSEVSLPTAERGIQDEHGDGHAADGRMGARMSLTGGGADCGSMTFVLPFRVCGRSDIRLSVPFKHGDVYWLSNCIGHKRFSLILHMVRYVLAIPCLSLRNLASLMVSLGG